MSKPSWVRGVRARSNHDVTLYGGRSMPCFCWANDNHTVGQEQRRSVAEIIAVTPPTADR